MEVESDGEVSTSEEPYCLFRCHLNGMNMDESDIFLPGLIPRAFSIRLQLGLPIISYRLLKVMNPEGEDGMRKKYCDCVSTWILTTLLNPIGDSGGEGTCSRH